MTKIKLCGLRRPEDIETAFRLAPDYIGFVFAGKSRRYITPEEAGKLKEKLDKLYETKDYEKDCPDKMIKTVGVFVDEEIENVAALLNNKIIDLAQLHGNEDADYISGLKSLSDKPVIQAFKIKEEKDLERAYASVADFILLDAGAGDGTAFDWSLLKNFDRKYFLAGGLNPENVCDAIKKLHPFAVDVSSGIETRGFKDADKMLEFVNNVRKCI